MVDILVPPYGISVSQKSQIDIFAQVTEYQ